MCNTIPMKSYSIRAVADTLGCSQEALRSYVYVMPDEEMSLMTIAGKTLLEMKEHWNSVFKSKYFQEYKSLAITPEICLGVTGDYLVIYNCVVAGDRIFSYYVDRSNDISIWCSLFHIALHCKELWTMALNKDAELLSFVRDNFNYRMSYNDIYECVNYNPITTYINNSSKGVIRCIDKTAIVIIDDSSCQVIRSLSPSDNLTMYTSELSQYIDTDMIMFLALFLCGVGYEYKRVWFLDEAPSIEWLEVVQTNTLR